MSLPGGNGVNIAGDWDSEDADREVIPRTPPLDASFREIDAWLVNRGWTAEDTRGLVWRSVRRGRVTIATHEEAQRIQRRRDRSPTPESETAPTDPVSR